MSRLLFNIASATSRHAPPALRTSSNRLSHPQTISFPAAQFFAVRCSSTETDAATPATPATGSTGTTDATNPSADDNEIKTGVVRFYHSRRQFGFIIPDGVHKHDEQSHLFVHSNDIHYQRGRDGMFFNPILSNGARVQFKIGPPREGAKGNTARDLCLEGGRPVPIFVKGYAERYALYQKKRFGAEVYEIMETSTSQHEMESRIVGAYEKVKLDIQSVINRMERAEKFMAENEESGFSKLLNKPS